MPPDLRDRERACELSISALVRAPAGSGKTSLLVHRLLRALATVDEPEQVVAITFTNKAAAEIRERVLKALRAARDALPLARPEEAALRASAQAALARDTARDWQLLAHPGRLRAQTIDAFCAQLGAQLPLLSGLGGSVAVSEDARSLYLEAIERLFDDLEDTDMPAPVRGSLARLLRWGGGRLDRLVAPLSGLLERREQWLHAQRAVEDWQAQDARALSALIAPALREFERVLDASQRAALIALLREGADEHELLGWAVALHAWPAADAANVDALRRLASLLLTGKGELRKSGGVNVKSGFVAKRPYTLAFKALLDAHVGDSALERAASTVRALPDPALPEELRALREDWLRVLPQLAARLRLVFAERQQADFVELGLAADAALGREDEPGPALLDADRRIRHLLVDEMQDTSAAQVALIRKLTQGWAPDDGRTLFLVGDPQQSIYAFRKAEVRLFQQLWNAGSLGALRLQRLELQASFRAQPEVVDGFNNAFRRIFPTQDDPLRGAVVFAPSAATRDCSGEDDGLFVTACADVDAEAAAAADEAVRRIAQGSVVVLARARSHLEPVIRALRARGLTPACQDIDPLAGLPEVRDVLALARALWHPQDRLSWAVLLRAPFVGLSWAQLVALSRGRMREDWPRRIAHALEHATLDAEGLARLRRLHEALVQSAANRALRAELADRTEAVWLALQGPACCSRAALDDVRQALRCLREETRGGGIRDLPRLERRLAELYAAPRAGQVQLMTVHKAKGLEFDHVLLVGTNRGTRSEDRPPLHLQEIAPDALLFVPRPDEAWPEDHPSHRLYDFLHEVQGAARRNEALRLLYVAITRARRRATLYLAVQRDDQGAIDFARGSFASALEPVIRAQVETQVGLRAAPTSPTSDAPTPRLPPLAPRLPLDLRLPEDQGLYRPTELRTLRPSEAVLSAQEEPAARRDEGDLYAQLVGTLFHEAMERISGEGLAAWADAGVSRRRSMAAGLRRRGMPEPLVEPAVARVIELLKRTLATEQGRWLVSPKPWARSEYPLAGLRDGRWISAVIDRCFEDGDGSLWVIDYKTSAQAVPEERIESYIAQGREKYREQITQYAALLSVLRPDRRVRAALYFAEADRLVEVDAADAA